MLTQICRIAVLLLLCKSYAFGQNSDLDSLRQTLGSTSNIDHKIDTYLEIAKVLQPNQSSEALSYCEQALELAKDSENPRNVSKVYNQLGIYWHDQNNLEKSTENYFEALRALPEHDDNIELAARINHNIGWNFQTQKDYKRALDYYLKSKELTEQTENLRDLGLLLNNIGVIYKNEGLLDEALQTFRASLDVNKQTDQLANQLSNINNIGVIYLSQGKYPLAIEYFSQAFHLNLKRNDKSEAANNLNNLGTAIFRSGSIEEAADTLESALRMAGELHLPELRHQVLKGLYDICLVKQDYKQALSHYTTYTALGDSLFRKGEYTALVELEAKYKVTQNERAIQLSQTQLLNQQLINAIILTALALAIMAIAFLTWVFMIKKKNEKELLALNKEIDSKNEKIQAINQNLEKTIEQRTQTIQAKNERLKEFAFMNSHKIRRPLSNLLGLVSLLQEEGNSPEETQDLIAMTEKSALELDDIIFEINHQLREDKSPG